MYAFSPQLLYATNAYKPWLKSKSKSPTHFNTKEKLIPYIELNDASSGHCSTLLCHFATRPTKRVTQVQCNALVCLTVAIESNTVRLPLEECILYNGELDRYEWNTKFLEDLIEVVAN